MQAVLLSGGRTCPSRVKLIGPLPCIIEAALLTEISAGALAIAHSILRSATQPLRHASHCCNVKSSPGFSTQSPLLHTCVTGKAGTGWSPYSSGLQMAPSGLSTQHMEVGSPVALLQLQGSRQQ
jgi:hypothetical protein